MSVDALKKITEELLETINFCMKNEFYQSALILIYSGIDTFAWLNLPESMKDVNRTYFEEWVNKYLLPNSGLECNATELYGARCGLLHSHIAESKLSRESEGEVREIYYAHGKQAVGNLQKILDLKGKISAVPVKIEELQDRFVLAILKYETYLADHPEEREIALKRTGKFLIKMKPLKKINGG